MSTPPTQPQDSSPPPGLSGQDGMKYKYASVVLGMDAADWINAVRYPGPPEAPLPKVSYRDIAPRLSVLIDQYVSHESVRKWHQSRYPEAMDAESAPATTTEE